MLLIFILKFLFKKIDEWAQKQNEITFAGHIIREKVGSTVTSSDSKRASFSYPTLKILALTPFYSPSHARRENNKLQLVNMILVLRSCPSAHLFFQLSYCPPIPRLLFRRSGPIHRDCTRLFHVPGRWRCLTPLQARVIPSCPPTHLHSLLHVFSSFILPVTLIYFIPLSSLCHI